MHYLSFRVQEKFIKKEALYHIHLKAAPNATLKLPIQYTIYHIPYAKHYANNCPFNFRIPELISHLWSRMKLLIFLPTYQELHAYLNIGFACIGLTLSLTCTYTQGRREYKAL